MNETASYRRILRSTSIMAGASVVSVLVGMVRVKVFALLLGPVGVGMLGLLNNLAVIASNIFALGVSSAGTRHVAEAAGRNDEHKLALIRQTLTGGALVMALAGSYIFWSCRHILADSVLNDAAASGAIGWLSLAVGLMVGTASQLAILNGLARIGDLARVTVYSAVISTVLGIGAVALWKEDGLFVYLIAAPAAMLSIGRYYVGRLPSTERPPLFGLATFQEGRKIASLGASFMIAGMVALLGQFAVRTILQQRLGLEALGLFEAAWTISMTYIGFVLNAMGSDYFPRLSAVAHDHPAAVKLMNEQTEVALILAGPVFLMMLAFAPWIIRMLYAESFDGAVVILRWQVMGDMLKVLAWPLGFLFLATGQGARFLLFESVGYGIFTLVTLLCVDSAGMVAVGWGFVAMYVVYLAFVRWGAGSAIGFRWAKGVSIHACLLLAAGAVTFACSRFSELGSALMGAVFSGVAAIYGWRALTQRFRP